MEDKMLKIISLAKRRGFVYPGSEIYGGLANTYDFGPLGALLLRNITNEWWDFFVTGRDDMYGMDSSILMNPKVWEASGHVANFNEALIDCKNCKNRTRADHIVLDALSVNVEGYPLNEIDNIITENKIKCPVCGNFNWTPARKFSGLFQTHIGILEESQSLAYLRGEIAQGMFVNFKNVLESFHPRLPFGIAQSGKAFRNEITKGNFIFRTLEFNLAEFEFFLDPRKDKWQDHFEYWKREMENWVVSLGVSKQNLRWRTHTDQERSHYSSRTEDLDFAFPFGTKEMFGLAYRTDYDLRNHMEKSGSDLRYTDPDTKEKFIPHVVEPTFGLNRILLALLCDSYFEDEDRVILKLIPRLAPIKAAVFPLVSNKEGLVKKAQGIYQNLKKIVKCLYDGRGNIGKRYYSADEIGIPWCLTVDYQTIDDDTVTLRHRDTTEQKRVKISDLESFFLQNLNL
ncbi:glycine--tRNA ligase [candidate division WWE3 bacterium RIFCSPHIGHO2_01_FULL_40_23]|uniref:glycine--tRNA ligase n=1 Tax=candidate division WWE3 bacterium RIFCSPLOWO2_01_FULL_41_18 TaxID=1802625 RepID=A0A1F4VCR4_UNCKA|nr:MAG: glycine--tRNA ligase [candidate division WWE3 bacterium RIFCSPHIGHO2_01_FULL_40_23]OGC54954.1 MAG: glycine--tRNA ligase [candidate division WWE3 bacterium RIFCSPLOWO2_01_FULL_41_18]